MSQGERYTIDFTNVNELDDPMKKLQIEFAVSEIDDDRSEVTMTAFYTPKWGPLGWVLGKTLMKRKIQEPIDDTLTGLKKHLETGETIDKEDIEGG
ncbi:MAG: hypothetical protein ABEI06_02120 [Halobacteriaceae archaeon]